MRIAVQGVFNTDLRDVTYGNARMIAELGFSGIGAHINVPAESISAVVYPRQASTRPVSISSGSSTSSGAMKLRPS